MNLKHIADALEYAGGTHTVGDIVDGILEGRYYLLENDGATLVWEFEHFPRLTRINGFLAAGDMNAVLELSRTLCQFATENNLPVVVYGRKGWEKALSELGFSRAHTVIMRAS